MKVGFTSCLTLALLTVHVLDFPFESVLQLPSRDFDETLEKVDHLIAAWFKRGGVSDDTGRLRDRGSRRRRTGVGAGPGAARASPGGLREGH